MSVTGKRLPLIVMRSNDICFLGILRSCRAANIPVIAITFDWPTAPHWYSEYSCCLKQRYEIANPFTDTKLAASQLAAILKTLHGQWGQRLMTLPSSDTNLMFILDHYAVFEPYILLMGDRDFAQPRLDVIHKLHCAALLGKTLPGLVPETESCSDVKDIDRIVDKMNYPVIYKPATKDYGQTFYSKHGGYKAIECDSRDVLRSALKQEMQDGFDLVVQEKIIFDSVYDEIPFYLYADAKGDIRMAANGIKELVNFPPYGTAIILRFAWFPELLELAQQVVAALSYRGILMIEFARDARDGNWKVIEVNPRHWLFNGFYQRLSFNFTECLYQDLRDELPDDSNKITANEALLSQNFVHMDLFDVARHIFDGKNKVSFDDYSAYLDSIEGTLTSAYFDFDDPEPGIKRIEDMCEYFSWPVSDTRDQIIERLRSK